ncbi:MAG: sensor hybrid histidine kinase [Caulobacteraceae bacterium]|nr:sensor hybrid histidine kinase [Caulobacteraceae bacterium]
MVTAQSRGIILVGETIVIAKVSPPFLAGGGDMGALVRAHDWSASSLGAPETWPQGLKTAARLLLSTEHPMFIWWRPDLIQLYNDAYRTSIGPERHPQALGDRGRECWAEIWDIIGPQIERVMAGEGSTWNENHLVPITRNGRREDVFWTYSYSPIDDPQSANGVGGVLVVCAETTETVNAERRHQAEKLRLEQMFQQAPSFIAMMRGPEHVFELVNQAYQTMMGPRPLIGLTVREAVPEAESQGFFEILDRVYRTGEPYVARRAPISISDGVKPPRRRFLDFVYQPVTDGDGAVVGIFAEGSDVTDHVEAEDALRAADERHQAVVDSIDQMIWSTLPDGFHDYYNQRWYDFTGVPQGSTDGEGWNGMFHPDDQERAWAVWRASLASGDPYHIEYRLRHRSGVYRWVLGRAQPLREPDGSITRWFGTCTDIQDIVDARDVLTRSRADLEGEVEARTRDLAMAHEALRQSQKMEAIGQLTGGGAHDFNNLLTVIRSSADLLRRRDLGEERRRRYVDAISDTADRAAKLTGQLLAFARRQALTPVTFNVAERLRSVADMLSTVLGGRIALTLDLVDEPLIVEADTSQFETALVNLAANARDAMEGEGRLCIGLRHVSCAPDEKLVCEAGFVAVLVKDSGSGIDADKVAKIFEPFFTTKGVGQGTGLGLSQVYGFVRQSGGEVSVETAAGEGATFTLYLPRSTKIAQAEARRSRPESEARQHGCILVVEDNAQVGEFSSELLNDLGYQTRFAANALDALKLLEEHPGQFDLVFSDIVMPGMDGLQLGQEIRRLYPGLPVVLTSGYSDVLAKEGSYGFELLHKPYSVESLSHALRRVLVVSLDSSPAL